MKSIYGLLIAGIALLMVGCATQSQENLQACSAEAKSPAHEWAREKLFVSDISPVALRDSSYPTAEELEMLEPFAVLASTCITYMIEVKEERGASDLYIAKQTAREVREVFAQLLAGEISYGEYYAGMIAAEAGEDAALAIAAEKRAQLAAKRQPYQPIMTPPPPQLEWQKRDRGQRCSTRCSSAGNCTTTCSPR